MAKFRKFNIWADSGGIAFGIFRTICTLRLSFLLAIHKVFRRRNDFLMLQILPESALAAPSLSALGSRGGIAFGIFRTICTLRLSFLLAIHKVFRRRNDFLMLQILPESALAAPSLSALGSRGGTRRLLPENIFPGFRKNITEKNKNGRRKAWDFVRALRC